MDLHGCGPLMTSHVRRFTADTGQSGEAEIPLPVLDFLPRRASWTDLGMVAADIEVRSESPDPAGDTGIDHPGRAAASHPTCGALVPFTRPRARGRVIPVRVSAGNRFPGACPGGPPCPQKLASDCGLCALAHRERPPGSPSHPAARRRYPRTAWPTSPPSAQSSARLSAARTAPTQTLSWPRPARTIGGWPGDAHSPGAATRITTAQVIGTLAERGHPPAAGLPEVPASARARSASPPRSSASPSGASCAQPPSRSAPTLPTSPQRPAPPGPCERCAGTRRGPLQRDDPGDGSAVGLPRGMRARACHGHGDDLPRRRRTGHERDRNARSTSWSCSKTRSSPPSSSARPRPATLTTRRRARCSAATTSRTSRLSRTPSGLLGIDCWICFATTRPAPGAVRDRPPPPLLRALPHPRLRLQGSCFPCFPSS